MTKRDRYSRAYHSLHQQVRLVEEWKDVPPQTPVSVRKDNGDVVRTKDYVPCLASQWAYGSDHAGGYFGLLRLRSSAGRAGRVGWMSWDPGSVVSTEASHILSRPSLTDYDWALIQLALKFSVRNLQADTEVGKLLIREFRELFNKMGGK